MATQNFRANYGAAPTRHYVRYYVDFLMRKFLMCSLEVTIMQTLAITFDDRTSDIPLTL